MIPTTVAFLFGILVASDITLSMSGTMLVLAIACVRRSSPRTRTAITIAFAFGLFDASLQAPAIFVADSHMVTLHAVVEEARKIDEVGMSFVARIDDGSRASFTLRGPLLPVGERFTVRAKREPFDEARNPSEPTQRDKASAGSRSRSYTSLRT